MADSKTHLLSSDSSPEDEPQQQQQQQLQQQRAPLPRPPPFSLPFLTTLREKRTILASQSPRRRQILSLLGLPNLEIIPSHAAEDLPKTLEPYEYVLETATKKAQAVYEQEIQRANTEADEPALILAADTVVVDASTATILEKPRSEAEHIAMLKALRDAGDYHRVYTGMAAMAPLASARQPGYVLETALEETRVRFDPEVSDEMILAYVRTREGADKAGGYGLQGLGSVLVDRIEGSWDNVVGLPLRAAVKLMERVLVRADDDDRLEQEGLAGDSEEEDEDE